MAVLFKLSYTYKALSDLKKIDKKIAIRVVAKIKENSEIANPLSRAKELSGVLSGIYRYRVGDYRVLFEIDTNNKIKILIILRIKHRKDAYKI